eukprot:3823721-Amphidinium_carterae.1
MASDPDGPPCRRRSMKKRPPMQPDVSEEVTRSVVHKKLEDVGRAHSRKKPDPKQPLLWLLHGPPGTGKSQ